LFYNCGCYRRAACPPECAAPAGRVRGPPMPRSRRRPIKTTRTN